MKFVGIDVMNVELDDGDSVDVYLHHVALNGDVVIYGTDRRHRTGAWMATANKLNNMLEQPLASRVMNVLSSEVACDRLYEQYLREQFHVGRIDR